MPTSKKLLQVGLAHFFTCVFGANETESSMYIASNKDVIFQSDVNWSFSNLNSGVISMV